MRSTGRVPNDPEALKIEVIAQLTNVPGPVGEPSVGLVRAVTVPWAVHGDQSDSAAQGRRVVDAELHPTTGCAVERHDRSPSGVPDLQPGEVSPIGKLNYVGH